MKVCCITLIIIISINYIICKNQIDYYDKLITDNIFKSITYICPHDNSKFFKKSKEKQEDITDNEEFDFIIVGAGAAGAVVASRLSEVNNWNILLLEAGEYEDDFSDIPFTGIYAFNSDRNWCYKAKYKSKSVFKLPYPRGKSVGGSTAINGMIYTRGNKEDYDNWARIGNPGWSYKEVLPYFKKLEKSFVPNDENYLGNSGPVSISYTELVNISAVNFYTKLFVDGAKEVNISYTNNYNGINQLGISHTQYTKFFGKRMSTGRAYLDKTKQHKNLKIVTNSLVTKILIDKNYTAYGVKFIKNGEVYTAIARKEVIISAGVVNSPQILMLSGIGPRDHLNKLNIALVKNLPVGKNLIEQCTYYMLLKTEYKERVKLSRRKEIDNFLKGKGILTNSFSLNNDIILFHTSNISSFQPEVESLVYIPILFLLYPFQQSGHVYFDKIFVAISLLHPKSRGEITLKSSNPKDFPEINLRMFSDPDDITTLYKNIKSIRNLISTKPFKEYKTRSVHIPSLCDVHVFSEKKYWECIIKNTAIPFFHPIGSNRMGSDSSSSVVDNELKVHGIKNLRVADASIIPVSISGHTSAPSIMVGEKAADLIKLSHNAEI